MNTMEEWYADLARAAAELGYIVEEVQFRMPGRIVLSDPRDHDEGRIVLEGSIFLNGDYIRRRLRPVTEAVTA